MDLRGLGLPDCAAVGSARLTRRAKYRQEIKECMRDRFRRVLGQFRLTATRTSRELLPPEVVLIGADKIKRGDWPLAVVEKFISGRDGKVQLVRLSMGSGTLLRPLQRIYPLEIYGERVPVAIAGSVKADPKMELTPSLREEGKAGPGW